ncbi:MAG: CPBP family intramembrane metalloprotease [Lachnospiraceae bacterium]|nr:CPBP family intramembrane metalloprotease [Lachnospiraceae bacterium]
MLERKKLKKRLTLFLVFTFLVTYLYEFLILFPQWRQVRSVGALKLAPVMFIPGIVALLVRLFTDEGFQNACFNPRFKRGKRKYYLMAWFLPAVLCIAGALLYFLFFRGNYSPDMAFYVGVLEKRGDTVSVPAVKQQVISSAAAGLLLAPILNIFTCFGEEWGWRAYLLPKLRDLLGLKKAVILSGIIWGLWHMPLTIMGHNYGLDYAGYPVTGILAMCLFCEVIGIFFAFLYVRTGSVFPAVFAHGALNGFASVGIYFTKDGGNPFIGPSVTGIIGGLPFIILAVFCFRALQKNNREAPELAEKKKPKPVRQKTERREPQKKGPEKE